MLKNTKVIRIVPDARGKGGAKSSLHSFQMVPVNDTSGGFNFHTWLNSWRKDSAANVLADPTLVTNGTFTGSLTPWTGTNWSYSSGAALHTAGSTAALQQTIANAVPGVRYDWALTVSGRTAGSITAIGLTDAVGSIQASDWYLVGGGTINGNATYTGTVVCRSSGATSIGATLFIVPSSTFDGKIDNVSLSLLQAPTNFDPVLPDGTTGRVYGFHVFNKYNTTDVALPPQTYLLSHYDMEPSGDYTNAIWCHSQSIVEDPAKRYLMKRVPRGVRTRFVTAKNRCFISTGDSEALIFQGAVTDPSALNQIQVPTYRLGIDQPLVAPTIDVVSAISSLEFRYYGVAGASYITAPSSYSALKNLGTGKNLTLNIYNAGVATTKAVVTHGVTAVKYGTTSVSDSTGYAVGPFPVPAPVFLKYDDWQWSSPVVYIRGTDWSAVELIGATISWETTSPDRQGRERTWQHEGVILSATYDGTDTKLVLDRIMAHKPGNATDPDGNPYQWELFLTGVHIPLAAGANVPIPANHYSFKPYPPVEVYPEEVVPLTCVATAGDLGPGAHTWSANTVGYAYAWYDPVTGHISNISPIGYNGEDKTNERPGINTYSTSTTGTGGLHYPPDVDRVRFTHMVLFRALYSAGGGGGLYVIGSLDPTAPNWYGLSSDPTKNPAVWYDYYNDSELLTAGGLRAPQFTNGKPVARSGGKLTALYPKDMVYWDSRLWLSSVQEPGAIRYSCDQVQCPFGVAEESFPGTNVLRIPADDGEITAMKMISDKLLVVTDRWAYVVAGNNETNYRLLRISTWMPGVGVHQIAEFPSDVEDSSGAICFLGRDRRVYMLNMGSSPVSISEPVQDFLDGAVTTNQSYEDTRLHAMVSNGKRVLFITQATGNLPPNLIVLEFDLDQQIWMRSNVIGDARAFGTRYVTEIVDRELVVKPDSTTLNIYSWWNPAATTTPLTGAVDTFPTNFDGIKTRKQIQFVKIYVAEYGGPSTWTLQTWLDGVSKGTVNFSDFNTAGTNYPATPEYSQTPAGYDWDLDVLPGWNVRELIVRPLEFLTSGYAAWCYRAAFRVNYPANTNLARIYAIDIGFTPHEEDGAIDP